MSGNTKSTPNSLASLADAPPIAPGRGSVLQQPLPKLFMWYELTPEREKKLIAEGKVDYINYNTHMWDELTPEREKKFIDERKVAYVDYPGKNDPNNPYAYMRAGIPPEQAKRLMERSKTGQALITRAPREAGGGTMNTDSMRLPDGVPKTNFSSKAGNVTVKSTKVGPAKNMFRANVAQGTLDANDTARMHAFLYRELLSNHGNTTDNMQKMNVTKEDILHSVMTGEDFKKFIFAHADLPSPLKEKISTIEKQTPDPGRQKELFKKLENDPQLKGIVTNPENPLHNSFVSSAVLQYKRIPVMQCENRVEDIMRNIAAGFYTIEKFENGKLTISTPEEKGIQYQVDLSTLAAAAPNPPLVAMDVAHAALYSDPNGPLGEHAATIAPLLGNIYYSNVKLEVKEKNDATFKPLMVAADEVVTGYKKENGKIVEVRETCAMKGDIDRFSAGMPKTPFVEGSNTPVNTFLSATNIDSLLTKTRAMFDKIYEIHNSKDKSGYDPEHVALSKQYMSEIEKALLLLPKNANLPDEKRATLLKDQQNSVVWKGMLGKSDLAGLTSLAGAASPHEFFTGVLDNFCSSCDPNNNFNTHYNHGMELRNPKKPSNLNAAYVIFLDGQNHYCPDEKSMTQTLVTAIQKKLEPGELPFFEKTRIELDPRWAFTVYDTNYAGTPEQKTAGTLYEDKDQTVKNWQTIFSSKIEFHTSEIQKAQAEIPPNTAHIKVQEGHLLEMQTKMKDQIAHYKNNYSGIEDKILLSDKKMDDILRKGSSTTQQIPLKLLEEHAELLNQQNELNRLHAHEKGWNAILDKITEGLKLPPVDPSPPIAPIISMDELIRTIDTEKNEFIFPGMEDMMGLANTITHNQARTMEERHTWKPPVEPPPIKHKETGCPPPSNRHEESAVTQKASTPTTTVDIAPVTQTAQSEDPSTNKRSFSRP